MRCRGLVRPALTAALLLTTAAPAAADDWYVSPKGTPQGLGSREAPWDVESALLGKRVGEQVTYEAPGGTFTYEVVDLRAYQPEF